MTSKPFTSLALILSLGSSSVNCASLKPYTASETNLFALSIAAQVADVTTTKYGLEHGLTEANPLYGSSPETAHLVLAKAAYIGLLYGVGELLPEQRELIYLFGAASGFLAAGWNTYKIGCCAKE